MNNVEALAHHDVVDLMLATRIPVPRLVDWVDQAILYLHTVDEKGKGPGRLRCAPPASERRPIYYTA